MEGEYQESFVLLILLFALAIRNHTNTLRKLPSSSTALEPVPAKVHHLPVLILRVPLLLLLPFFICGCCRTGFTRADLDREVLLAFGGWPVGRH